MGIPIFIFFQESKTQNVKNCFYRIIQYFIINRRNFLEAFLRCKCIQSSSISSGLGAED